MFDGYFETPEKIEARKRRILATQAQEAEAFAEMRASVNEMQSLIQKARGELGIQKLFRPQSNRPIHKEN